MKKKIDIAELLKDCPKDMELNCTMYDDVSLIHVSIGGAYPIKIETPDGQISLNKYGCYSNNKHAKCVIFPKGETTWEGFHRPFKDGDIISDGYFDAICIFKGEGNLKGTVDFYCGIDGSDELFIKDVKDPDEHFGEFDGYNFATEEEKEKLFQAIKDNGYKWNAETKTLEKLIVPKFKVGDRIKNSDNCRSSIVVEIKDVCFIIKTLDGLHNNYLTDKLPFSKQDEYEVVTDKFDITTLKPFDKVLVRGDVEQRWIIDFFGFMDNKKGYPFVCVGHYVTKCIPYEGNEHLLGKTDDCAEFYKTWE